MKSLLYIIIIWLLHNLVEASFDLFRYLLLGDQLKPRELHPLVSYTSKVPSHQGYGLLFPLYAGLDDIAHRYAAASGGSQDGDAVPRAAPSQ